MISHIPRHQDVLMAGLLKRHFYARGIGFHALEGLSMDGIAIFFTENAITWVRL